MTYCKNCKQEVEPKSSNFSVLAFVILLIIGVVPGIIYIIYHKWVKTKKCPMCNSQNWGTAPEEKEPEPKVEEEPAPIKKPATKKKTK